MISAALDSLHCTQCTSRPVYCIQSTVYSTSTRIRINHVVMINSRIIITIVTITITITTLRYIVVYL
jgi:hypothetical protein